MKNKPLAGKLMSKMNILIYFIWELPLAIYSASLTGKKKQKKTQNKTSKYSSLFFHFNGFAIMQNNAVPLCMNQHCKDISICLCSIQCLQSLERISAQSCT